MLRFGLRPLKNPTAVFVIVSAEGAWAHGYLWVENDRPRETAA